MKKNLRIALAQLSVTKGSIRANLQKHIELIELAAEQHANVIVFPELSLTGYEPDLLEELAFTSSDESVLALSRLATYHNMVIVCGLSLQNENEAGETQGKPYIAAAICQPSRTVSFYRKQYLHEGEATFCARGKDNVMLSVKGNKLALAICADFSDPQHAKDAQEAGADIYLVSALISQNGYEHDSQLLADIAKTHRFPVLLSNFVGETGGWETAGQNRVWDINGGKSEKGCTILNGILLCSLTGNEVLSSQFHPGTARPMVEDPLTVIA
ncbi:carbon-nitrogen hydrolase family protein [Enterovibrio norvegicus]|uniref:carbon-nitrogen hydrolase family protein n=1 Tax=Enterovibrio norvegicus TaxID=188144 RepID=UPI000C82D763|nr:carbon-nitrogen hydrolase family protein [Enterovibrio norvegicus]PMN74072.1 hypothetical protein BCT27_00400 [Enterovibrio norvegicus]